MVIMAGLLTRSDLILRPQLFITSPPKSFYPAARVCFHRNTNSLSSSSGIDHRLVLSVPPHHKLNNVNYYYAPPDSKEINKPFVVLYNNHDHQSIINSSCENHSNNISVYNRLVELKKTVVNTFASLFLVGFLVFMTSSTFKSSAFAASLSSYTTPYSDCNTSRPPFAKNTNKSRVSSVSRTNKNGNITNPTRDLNEELQIQIIAEVLRMIFLSPTNKNDNITNPTRDLNEELQIQIIAEILRIIFLSPTNKNGNITNPTRDLNEELQIQIIGEVLRIIFFIILAPLTIPLFAAIIAGYKYYLALCEDTKEKSLLMLQVGVLDKTWELQGQVRNITQIANTSNLDEVVKALLHRCDSYHFAYLSVTQCISDEKKYGNNFAEMMDSIEGEPEALINVYDLFKYFAKSLAKFIHWSLIKAIKKINYNDKCSKQLFAEVLTRELAKHEKDEETLASVDGMKCKDEAVGKAHGMVDNDYLLVTILVLASGVYSIPPLQCNTEHVKKVLQKFSTIPKSKIESLQVLMTPQTEIEGVTEQGLRRNFPLLKPLTLSGLEK